MGADIHLAVERYDEKEGRWVNMPRPEPIPRWKGSERQTWDWYSSRNYTVFACLAGVRRDEEPQIAARRGIPADVDPRSLDQDSEDAYGTVEYDNRADGEHSASWLTLKEVLTWPVWLIPKGEVEAVFANLVGYRADIASDCSEFLRCMQAVADHAEVTYGITDLSHLRIVFNFDS